MKRPSSCEAGAGGAGRSGAPGEVSGLQGTSTGGGGGATRADGGGMTRGVLSASSREMGGEKLEEEKKN